MRDTPEHRDIMHEMGWLGLSKIDDYVDPKLLTRSKAGIEVDGDVAQSSIVRGTIHASTQGLNPTSDKLFDLSVKAQSLLRGYQTLHGNLLGLRGDLQHHMKMNLYGRESWDQMPSVVAYALLAETPYSGELINSLSHQVDNVDLEDIQAELSKVLLRVRRFQDSYLPPFPIASLDDIGLKVYHDLYRPDTYQASSVMLDKLINGDIPLADFKHMLERLDRADAKSTAQWATDVPRQLPVDMIGRPADQVDKIREAVNGTKYVPMIECTKRLEATMDKILGTRHYSGRQDAVKAEAKTIISNELYAEKVLMTEVFVMLQEAILEFDSLPELDTNSAGQLSVNLGVFIRELNVSDADISALILNLIGNKTVGAAYAEAYASPTCGAVFGAKHLFQKKGKVLNSIQEEPSRAVCFGLMHAMSQHSMRVAMQHDEAKIVYYELTLNRKTLEGLKDKSLMEGVFSTDLGL